MDLLIFFVAIAFVGLIVAFSFHSFKETRAGAPKLPHGEKNIEADVFASFQKKIKAYEEKIKKIEFDMGACQLECAQAKEREKMITNERSQVKFDTEQYEKFKKEFQALKKELTAKEEILEKEISSRRTQAADLAATKQDNETLKKKLSETEDALRKHQALSESLTKEVGLAKNKIKEQEKVVRQHSENKMEGEWVSRMEFEKIERDLKEKEAQIQKFLSLKNNPDHHA
jgi:chromosome segregation ATPase